MVAKQQETDYKEDCIFCKIAKKEIPPLGEGLFREDEDHMAWLSPFPNTEGFSVVIPKKHFDSDILKMPSKPLHKLMDATKEVGGVLENYYEDVGRVGVMMEGTGIGHAHIKLFPMHNTSYLEDGFQPFPGDKEKLKKYDKPYFEEYPGFIASHDGGKADENEIKNLAEKIKKTID